MALTMAVCSRTHLSQPVRERHKRAELADSQWLIKKPPEHFCGQPFRIYLYVSLFLSPSKCLPDAESA